MKIVDRYLLRSLMVPLGYLFAAFVLVYVVYDLFDNLPDFIDARTPLPAVLRFYAMLMPSVLIFIVPASLLFSMLYTLATLTRHNELTAMRASGLSLIRLMTPYVLTGLAAAVAVALVHERLGPASAYWTQQFLKAERGKGIVDVHVAEQVALKDEESRRIWLIGRFDTRTLEMQNVEVIQQSPEGRDLAKIYARSAQWLDGRWWFMEVSIQPYDPFGNPMGPPRYEIRREMSDLTETPADFISEIKDPEFLSSRELARYLETHRQLSPETLARVRVDMHHRLAMPWTSFVVALLGIAFGVQTGRKGALTGVLLSVSLFFGLYLLINLGLALGKKQVLDAWIAAWGPNLLFLAVASLLLIRLR